MKKIPVAIIAAALLVLSIGTMAISQKAAAQTGAIGVVEQRMKLVPVDGGPACYRTNVTPLPAGQLVGNTCTDRPATEIASFVFEIWVLFNSNDYTVTSSTLSSTVKVFTRDGIYKEVPLSGNSAISRVSPTSNVVWQVYSASVSSSTVESVIGKGLADYTADIRLTTSAGSLTVKNSAGQVSIKSVASQTTTFSFTQKGTSSGGSIGDNTIPPPTGRVFNKITLFYKDANGNEVGSSTYLSNDLTKFDLTAKGDGQKLSRIVYKLNLWLDRENYILQNENLSHENNGLTDNYGILLDNKLFGNSVTNPRYERIYQGSSGSAFYQILEMRVNADDIENALTTPFQGTPPPDLEIKTGKLTFYNRASTLSLKDSLGKLYTINIPADNVVIDLTSFKPVEVGNVGGESGGEIICEGTECEVKPDQQGGFDQNMLLIAGAAVIVGGVIAGGALMARRKK